MVKVIKFGAPWCNPCKMLDPVLHQIQDERSDVEFEFVDIDTDEGAEKAGEFGVMGVPRVMIFKGEEKVEDFAGFKPKEAIDELLEKHL